MLVAAAENAISEKSMRPLDSIATAAGIMVEVGNTDAEGRLVLADALHHALTDDDAPHPDFLIDFATTILIYFIMKFDTSCDINKI